MVTKSEILSEAVDKCMKELYSYAVPHIEWEDFIKENKEYKDGPEPYEFYYLPEEIIKNICDSYIYAYRLDGQQELLNTIEILKNYCKKPIIERYIEGENGDPGYRVYDNSDNLEKEIEDILFKSIYEYDLADLIESDPKYKDIEEYPESERKYPKNERKYVAEKLQTKFFEFLDMAGKFYKWNGELNSFNASVYLGASPCSNKNTVIENWKKYRNKDIEIDEEQIKKEYYGED